MSNAQYIHAVDFEALEAEPNERIHQRLLPAEIGVKNCEFGIVRTPAGGGSPAGMHTHDEDQIFYLISGTMCVEIDGVISKVKPGHVIAFPAGVPHRNWNEDEATVHLTIVAPRVIPGKKFSYHV